MAADLETKLDTSLVDLVDCTESSAPPAKRQRLCSEGLGHSGDRSQELPQKGSAPAACEWPALPSTGYAQARNEAEKLSVSAHDAGQWRQAFSDAGDGTKRAADMPQIRGLRRLVWLQTEEAITLSLAGKAAQPHLAALDLQKNETLTFTGPLLEVLVDEVIPKPKIEVVERDILEEAEYLVRQGFKVAVLNMANATTPGGGFIHGAGAQEENLHRRSDMVRFTMEQRQGKYPIPDNGCLLSQGVTIFRGTEQNGYQFLNAPFHVSVVSCAAINHPELVSKRIHGASRSSFEYASVRSLRAMELKANLIVSAAISSGCNAMVLSAFGCGAFGNPPELVADIFRRILRQCPMEQTTFCIFNDHNSGLRHNPRGNYLPFTECFPVGLPRVPTAVMVEDDDDDDVCIIEDEVAKVSEKVAKGPEEGEDDDEAELRKELDAAQLVPSASPDAPETSPAPPEGSPDPEAGGEEPAEAADDAADAEDVQLASDAEDNGSEEGGDAKPTDGTAEADDVEPQQKEGEAAAEGEAAVDDVIAV